MRGSVDCYEVAVEDTEDHAENDLQEKDESEDEVDLTLDLGHLVSFPLRVHHDLAVTARINSQPIDPFSILQPSLAIQQLFILTEIDPALALHLER